MGFINFFKSKTQEIKLARKPVAITPFSKYTATNREKSRIISLAPHFFDPLNFKPFVIPVITSYGKLYSSHTIAVRLLYAQVDPCSGKPLNQTMLHEPPAEILNLITAFNKLYPQLKDAVEKKIDEEQERHNEFELLRLEMEMKNACDQLETRCVIDEAKDHLKLDADNPEHISFWKQKGNMAIRFPNTLATLCEQLKMARSTSLWMIFLTM